MKERKGIFVLRILLNLLFPIRKLLFPWVPVIKKVSSRERIKILLFFMSPGIGDAVISTFFLRGLRQIFPNSVIDLFTLESASLITNNPALDRFTIVSATEQHNLKLLLHRLPALRKEKYDIIIDIPWFQKGYSASRIAFLYFIKAGCVLSSNTRGFSFIDNVSWNFPEETVREVYMKALRILENKAGLKEKNFFSPEYELILPEKERKKAKNFLKRNNIKEYVLFNPEGSTRLKSLSEEKTLRIAGNIAASGTNVLILNCGSGKQNTDGDRGRIVFFEGSIYQAAALVKEAMAVLTVDTSILHIADVWQVPMTVLYSENNGFDNPYVWRTHAPLNPHAGILYGFTVENIPDLEIISAVKKCLAAK